VEFNPFRYKDASIEHDTQPKGNKMNMTREALEEYLGQMGETPLLMDGFDEACIGFSQRINEPFLAVYSYEKMIEVLMERDGMDDETAMEYIDFNCVGSWMGEKTPIIVMPIEL
jgi:hypothetical protein